MSVTGEEIFKQRKSFLSTFIPVFQEFYTYISGGNESVGLSYRSHHEHGELFGEYPMKRIGSQGQNKTFLIALKLAQFDFLNRNGFTSPILLLDDIFDKLDSQRMERIISLVSEERFGQIFITDTNREYLDEIIRKTGHDFHLYQVIQGNIESLKEEK